jgi:hypothetical protein
MSDEQWRALVAKWLDPKHMVNICCQIFFFQNQFTNFLILSHWSHAGNMWKQQAESQSSEVSSGYGLSQLYGTLASFCKWTIYYTSTYSFALNNLFIWSDTTLVCLIKNLMQSPAMNTMKNLMLWRPLWPVIPAPKRVLVKQQEKQL